MNLNNKELLRKIQKNDPKAFEVLFREHYSALCRFAASYLQDDKEAEEIVQDFFVGLWQFRHTLQITTSVRSYLIISIRNACLNQMKHRQVRQKYAQKTAAKQSLEETNERAFREVNLELDIQNSIAELPEKRRQIFLLSREKGWRHKEIAQELGISIKTVENQINLSIKHLRKRLKPYLNKSFIF